MPGRDYIVLPDAAPFDVALEPAQSAIHSLVLLVSGSKLSGVADWVARTAAALTQEESELHELVMIGLHYAVVPQSSWPSFPAYLEHLATCDPVALRDKMMEVYARFPPLGDEGSGGMSDEPLPFDQDAVLADVDAYLGFLRERFEEKIIDVDLETRAYSYAIDPPAMQALIVSHLQKMWETHLAPEWEQAEPMLRDAVEAFRQVNWSEMSKPEAMEYVAGPAYDGEKCCRDALQRAERILFVPHPHVGPYLGTFYSNGTLWVLFGARLPAGVPFHAPDLSRAEILMRISALADDNRLHILRLVAEKGEQRSQDIISSLGLSQSTVSRHLKQLSAIGYLLERRCNGAKCYQLDGDRIQNTLQAIETFLLSS
jgi:DNA-binding transcriptional ArsR family regulator